jgi:transcriptional regulator with XRE-family HTH domain
MNADTDDRLKVPASSSGVSHKPDRYGDFYPTEWGKRVKRMRHLRGWTLEEVAKRIGVKKTTVSQWETGRIQKLEGDNMLAVCKLFGTTPEQLLYGEEPVVNRPLVNQL